jgi:multiple sugar transport system permease protein
VRIKYLSAAVSYFFLCIGMVLVFVPIGIVYLNSLRTEDEIWQSPLGLPSALHWENYWIALTGTGTSTAFGQAYGTAIGRYVVNSFIMTVPALVFRILLSALAAYAFAYMRFRFKQPLFYAIMIALMIPEQSIILPLYQLFVKTGIFDTYLASILPHIALDTPLVFLVLRGFYKEVSSELLDSARVDGASNFRIFWKLVTPMIMPAVTAMTAMNFLWIWNSFFLNIILIQTDAIQPVTVGLLLFRSRYKVDIPLMSAGVAIAALPPILLYILLQKYFVQGMFAGAIKG